jgi:hypothetical protein
MTSSLSLLREPRSRPAGFLKRPLRGWVEQPWAHVRQAQPHRTFEIESLG